MALGRLDRKLSAVAVAVALGAATLSSPTPARAEGPVSPTGKGIVGGALLGGEVVMLTMGAIGIESGWPYIVFGGLGAVGGGIGGFFVEDSVSTAEAPLYMLAGGMALVIPTVVVTLNAISYKPPADDKSEPADNKPAIEPAPPGGSVTVTTSKASPAPAAKPRPTASRTPRTTEPVVRLAPARPLAMVGIDQGQLALRLPAPEIRPTYSAREMAEFGVEQRTEVRVPVFQASF